MKKITTTNNKPKKNKNKINKDIIVISGEEYTNKPERPSYICNYCSRTLSKIYDNNDNDNTFWCNKCSIEFQPEKVRRKQKLVVPERNTETLVATTPDPVSQFDHKPPELKGGLKALQQKGIKITNYQEHIPR